MGDSFPAFRGTESKGQSVLLALALSQVNLIQNNPRATVAYCGGGLA